MTRTATFTSLIAAPATALLMGLAFTGTAHASAPAADPPWNCMGGTPSSNGKCPQSASSSQGSSSSSSSQSNNMAGDKPTPKKVCRAWESQGAQNFNQTDHNLCRFLPGD